VDIEAGISPQCPNRPSSPLEWGVLKLSSISWGEFQPDENKVLPAGFEPDPRLEVRIGDVLISRGNVPALVGRTAYVWQTRPRLILSDITLRLVPNKSLVEPRFLNLVLGSDSCRRQIVRWATGSSLSMVTISRKTLRKVIVPQPAFENRVTSLTL
jgi:type I restriction enzyme, S subunit